LIQLNSITKTYKLGDETIYALNNINLIVKDAEFLAIVGPSGSGKTTLANIIGGLDASDSGEVIVDGQNLANSKDNTLSDYRNKKIGFVFQSFNLLPRTTVTRNVMLPLIYNEIAKKERKQIVESALNSVGIAQERWNHFSNELSGGQMQRVAIARAMINHPDVLIADEPTGNLDPFNTSEIIKLLLKINELGTVVILATHNKEIIDELKKRVISLEKGKIVKDEERGRYIS